MGVGHVFDGVGDDLAARQRVQHSAVAHGDAVVDGDRVELTRDATGGPHRLGDDLADVLEMDVAGHELGVRVRDGDDRLAEIGIGQAGGAPQGARAGCITSDGGGA